MTKQHFLLLLFLGLTYIGIGQINIAGVLIDAVSQEKIAFVSIGIKQKNIGTSGLADGSFLIYIPKQHENDTLSFSMIGYEELNLPISFFVANPIQTISLIPHSIELPNVIISAQKLIEKKIGIVKHNPVVHFTDGSINQNDIFEIAQVVKLGDDLAKITSVSLYINESQHDSAIFRINFYAFEEHFPAKRLIEKNIMQTHRIQAGWLKFDISADDVYLKGNVVVAIEFIPNKKKNTPIYYEIKLGGKEQSFVRKSSLGTWSVPPHHYRMYVTTLMSADKKQAEVSYEEETLPTTTLYSSFVKDSFSIFIRLPNKYIKNKKYQTVYLLDANVYFDNVCNSINLLIDKGLTEEMILIGIGYKDFLTMDSLRNRDYTFPQALAKDSFSISGGAADFLAFIRKELIPYIDKKYQTNPQKRSIMGHSLGGYFVLFALENEINNKEFFFQNHVAASPSLAYSDKYILTQFQLLKYDTHQRNLLLTMEGLDEGKKNEEDIHLFSQLLRYLKTDSLKVQSEIYPNFEHLETAIPTFEKGLEGFGKTQK